ncbi:hypothetical protein BKA65DRAFT_511855 [Rhexocercosporidium sp. MPI-PUGE-AT-0058]|nr:hypothetical protein BKA65DRAFT_511855 [Rhexocercosporidium sp. MPI-PUGE-AT-0058]
MCRSESLWQSSSGCQCLDQSEDAHIYNQITYFLCHESRDGRPCQNVVPSAEDVFSSIPLLGSCPVCEAIDHAFEVYNAVEAQARKGPQEQYEATIQHAAKLKQKELDDAYSVIRIVRPKRGATCEISTSQKKRLPFISYREPDSSDEIPDDRQNQLMENAYITRKSVIEDASALHPVYRVISKPRKYFKPGRVFSVVWTEPAGPSKYTSDSKNITPVSFDQYAWTEIRRFVVARDMSDHCLALPIHTFGGRGSQKPTARPQDQRPIFAISEDWDKSTLSEQDIPVKVEDPDVDIKKDVSFVLFSKHYSVEHYLPIRNIGHVVKEALPILESCFLVALGISDAVRPLGTSVKRNLGPGPIGLVNSVDSEPILDPNEQMLFTCDYDACHRTRQKTYSRKDAYRDHLRDFHNEDILSSRRTDDSWFNTRDIQEDWWRCRCCLSRVSISPNGYVCSSCNEPCEVERINARKALLEELVPKTPVIGKDLVGDRSRWANEFRELTLQTGQPDSSRSAARHNIGKSSGRARRKVSDAKAFKSIRAPAKLQDEDHCDSEFGSGPLVSFLFQVNQLPIDDGNGVPLRTTAGGYWIPPIYMNGFGPQSIGNLYRWNSNGRIRLATDCPWNNGFRSRSGELIRTYSTRTVFWCNPWSQFMVATGDASDRNMADSEHPHNVWWPLSFEHDGGISRVTESAQSPYLFGTGPDWIAGLGLRSYKHREDDRAAEGLSGNLATLFGIIAMSCSAGSFDNLLPRALRDNIWLGHNHQDGRSDKRGVVVHIYLDPENPDGSTADTLSFFEFDGPPLIR